MKKEKSCGAVVCRKGENGLEILLIQHKNGGHWAFPKGHVEKKETEEEPWIRPFGRWSPILPSPV